MKLKTVSMALLFGTMIAIVACSKSDDPKKSKDGSTGKLSTATKAKLIDKLWYSQAQGGGIDLEFLSDGTFRQAKSLDGTWVWLNNGDTMSISDYQNKKFKYVFDEITDNTMKYRTDLGGNGFQTQYLYSTTK